MIIIIIMIINIIVMVIQLLHPFGINKTSIIMLCGVYIMIVFPYNSVVYIYCLLFYFVQYIWSTWQRFNKTTFVELTT